MYRSVEESWQKTGNISCSLYVMTVSGNGIKENKIITKSLWLNFQANGNLSGVTLEF